METMLTDGGNKGELPRGGGGGVIKWLGGDFWDNNIQNWTI